LNTAKGKPKTRVLTQAQRDVLNGFYRYMQGQRYSTSTIRTYSNLVADFVEFLREKPINSYELADVNRFLEAVFIPKRLSVSTHRQFISALKVFITYMDGECSIALDDLVRPNKARSLPTVLSQQEVIDLIRCTRNLKHRVVLGLLYSAGLRIGELLKLKIKDINFDRRIIYIHQSKGKKDRYVPLAESMLPLLRNYWATYKPSVFLVEGQAGGPYSASSIRKFLDRSCKRARIYKPVTPHTLRHSYATHLLENGVGLRHIQVLLGHAKPETTMVYTHVAKSDLIQIESPLDSMMKQLSPGDIRDEKFLLSRNSNF
jgi:site-specific recombinase XerD